MKFGENLKIIRKQKKISQDELAEKLNVSRQSISKWENAESYPTMNNILELCKIFKCHINDLVHNDMSDINSLDKEIKMSVVKFKENEQKKMKGLSKLIYIIARIFKAISIVGIVCATLFTMVGVTYAPTIKMNNNKISFKGIEYNYHYENNILTIDTKDNINFTISNVEFETIEKFCNKSILYKSSLIIVTGISLIISLILIFITLKEIEKLFINIHDNHTPFTMKNVQSIKKIAIYSCLSVFVSDAFGILVELIYSLNLNVEIELTNYLLSIVILIISYIFKYGYEIQLDSKGIIYDEK